MDWKPFLIQLVVYIVVFLFLCISFRSVYEFLFLR